MENKDISKVKKQRKFDVKKMVVLAMLAALAFVAVLVCRVPVVMFLKYEPKDVVIAIGGFIYGPLAAIGLSAVVSLIEMVTISTTGFWGFLMNMLSTCMFVCPAALIYKKHRTLGSAILGLAIGSAASVSAMMLWNYLITPIYLGYPRSAVVDLLLPVFLPFNALKSSINAVLTILLYKPISGFLKSTGLVKSSEKTGNKQSKGKFNYLVSVLGIVFLALLLALLIVYIFISAK